MCLRMNKARAMLDALMGPGRDEGNKDPNKVGYKDRTVCKGFLLGFCPYDKSVLGGKRTIEVCKKIHSEVMQSQFNADPNAEQYRKDCELVSLRDLEAVIAERDKFMATERDRIREEHKRRKAPLPPDVNIKISAMKREALTMGERAEALDDHQAREKEQLVKRAAELKQEMEDYMKAETQKADERIQKEELCEVCGTAYTGQDDYETHLRYRVHKGYEMVIERLAELKEKKAAIEKEKEAERKEKRKKDWEKAQGKDGDGEKTGEKSGEKDKDRSRSKSRGDRGRKSQSPDRADNRGRGERRDRSRSRNNRRGDRGRNRSRERRERSRSRDRGGDRGDRGGDRARRDRSQSRGRRERSRSDDRGDRRRNRR